MATPMIIWSVLLRPALWPPLLLVPLEGDADAELEGVDVVAGIVDCPEGVGWGLLLELDVIVACALWAEKPWDELPLPATFVGAWRLTAVIVGVAWYIGLYVPRHSSPEQQCCSPEYSTHHQPLGQ